MMIDGFPPTLWKGGGQDACLLSSFFSLYGESVQQTSPDVL